ncbi:MAG: hypothetical protein ACI906_001154 [Candidatus Latescibacterota bacterium]|jgi:hypothetical protein
MVPSHEADGASARWMGVGVFLFVTSGLFLGVFLASLSGN